MSKPATPSRARKQAAAPAAVQQTAMVTTTMRLKPEIFVALKKLAADRGCKVNDLVQEGLAELLKRAGR